jgi:hypothetical protein
MSSANKSAREVIPGLNAVMVVGLAMVFIFSTPGPGLSVRLRSLLDASGKTIMCILIIVLDGTNEGLAHIAAGP